MITKDVLHHNQMGNLSVLNIGLPAVFCGSKFLLTILRQFRASIFLPSKHFHYLMTFQTPYRVTVFHVLDREKSLDSSVSDQYLVNPFNSSLAVRLLDTQVSREATSLNLVCNQRFTAPNTL